MCRICLTGSNFVLKYAWHNINSCFYFEMWVIRELKCEGGGIWCRNAVLSRWFIFSPHQGSFRVYEVNFEFREMERGCDWKVTQITMSKDCFPRRKSRWLKRMCWGVGKILRMTKADKSSWTSDVQVWEWWLAKSWTLISSTHPLKILPPGRFIDALMCKVRWIWIFTSERFGERLRGMIHMIPKHSAWLISTYCSLRVIRMCFW